MGKRKIKRKADIRDRFKAVLDAPSPPIHEDEIDLEDALNIVCGASGRSAQVLNELVARGEITEAERDEAIKLTSGVEFFGDWAE